MSRIKILIALFTLLVAVAPAEDKGFVVICPLTGPVDQGMAVVAERAVKAAAGAQAIIFALDTPGGALDSCLEIVESVLDAPCRTVAYAEGMGAISAGAIISYACKDIVMSPTANMGAAAPVMFSPEGIEPLGEKEVSYVRAKMRTLAEHNGHNPAIAEAMVDKDIELRAYMNDKGELIVYKSDERPEEDESGAPIADTLRKAIETFGEKMGLPQDLTKDSKEGSATENQAKPEEAEENPPLLPGGTELILPKGKLLTLSPQEAIRYGVIPCTCDNVDQVMSLYGYADLRKEDIEMTWAEQVFRFLTNPTVSGILLMAGLACLYLEAKTPGFGAFGVAGIVCLVLLFGARAVLGLADWIDLLLILTGVILLGVEIFVLPGFGIVGAAGIVCLLVGFVLSFTLNDFTWPEYDWQFARIEDALYSLLVAVVSFAVFLVVAWKALPHTPLYPAIVQQHTQQTAAGYIVQTQEQTQAAIGLRGVALSMLRPAGRGRFGGKTYSVVSRGQFIEEGTSIVIIAADGNRYVVDRIQEKTK